jgi:hypothetical protein
MKPARASIANVALPVSESLETAPNYSEKMQTGL